MSNSTADSHEEEWSTWERGEKVRIGREGDIEVMGEGEEEERKRSVEREGGRKGRNR